MASEIMTVTGTIQDYLPDPTKSSGIKDLIDMQSFDQHLVELYKATSSATKWRWQPRATRATSAFE